MVEKVGDRLIARLDINRKARLISEPGPFALSIETYFLSFTSSYSTSVASLPPDVDPAPALPLFAPAFGLGPACAPPWYISVAAACHAVFNSFMAASTR